MYEVFDHTADIGLRITAPDLPSLFGEAGRGLASLLVENLEDVRPLERLRIELEEQDPAFLLFDWLNELLYRFERDHLLLAHFDLTLGEGKLEAEAAGERIDRRRHRLDHEVKAITYHALKLEQTTAGWRAEVIVDI